MKRVTSVLRMIQSRTGVNLRMVMSGQFVTLLFGYIANVILIRTMEPDDYGQYLLLVSTVTMLAGLFHFGWFDTAVKFGAEIWARSEFEMLQTLLGRVQKRIMLGAILFGGIIVYFSEPWSLWVLRRPDFSKFLILGVLGAWITLLSNWIFAAYRLRQDFRTHSLWVSLAAAIRAAGFVVVVAFGLRSFESISHAYIGLLLAFSIFQLLRFYNYSKKHGALQSSSQSTETPSSTEGAWKTMCGYNRWTVFAIVTTQLIGNLDSFFIAHFHINREIAILGVANRVLLPFQYVVSALTLVALPRLSAARSISESDFYLKKVWWLVVPICTIAGICGLFAEPIISIIAGPTYTSNGLLFRVLLLSQVFILLANPLGIVLLARNQNKGLAWMNFFQLLLYLGLSLLWVPRLGALGSAWVGLSINLVGFVLVLIQVKLFLRKSTNHFSGIAD